MPWAQFPGPTRCGPATLAPTAHRPSRSTCLVSIRAATPPGPFATVPDRAGDQGDQSVQAGGQWLSPPSSAPWSAGGGISGEPEGSATPSALTGGPPPPASPVSLVQDAVRVLASALDCESSLQELVRLAVPRLGDSCTVHVLNEDGTLERVAAARHDTENVTFAYALDHLDPLDRGAEHGVHHVLRTGTPELVSDLPDPPPGDTAGEEGPHVPGARSTMIVPIRAAQGVLGAASFVTAGGRFTAEDLRLAEHWCDCAAIAIRDARLRRGLQAAREEAASAAARSSRLHALATDLAGTVTLADVADIAMNEVFGHLGAAASILYVLREGTFQLLAATGVRWRTEEWRTLPLDAPLPLCQAIRERRAEWIEDRAALLVRYPAVASASAPASELAAVAAIPLMVQGAVIGGLAFSFVEERQFSPTDREVLLSMAALVAQSLERARLRETEEMTRFRLQENEARYRYIFQAAPVGIAEKDYTEVKHRLDAIVSSGVSDLRAHLGEHPELVEEAIDLVRVRDVNEAMMRLFRAKSKADVLSLRRIFLPESRGLFVEELLALMEGTRIVSGETTLRTLDGEPITVIATVTFPPAGFDRVLISRTDITEQRRILEERQQLVEQLATTVRLNEMFTAILGHDLRNPLGAMITAAHLVSRISPEESVRRAAGRILSSGERMARMITQLLDFTRTRTGGGLVLEPREVDLAALCRQILAEVEDANQGRSIELQVSGEPRGIWDPDRMGQVISNLAGNACQHGVPATPVRIELDGRDADVLVLEVVNTGEIPAESLEGLFEPFRRSQTRRDVAQGLGLGLYITQQIVHAHGGRIDVCSAGGATRFVVSVPRGKVRSA